MVNRCILIGRLTQDPEARVTANGKSVCNFQIAVSKRVKPTDGSPDADFFRVSAWGSTADFVSSYLGKGRLVAVEGRLQSRKFQASDGSNREVVEVVADSVQGLDRPKEEPQGKPTARRRDDDANNASREYVDSGIDSYDPFEDEE